MGPWRHGNGIMRPGNGAMRPENEDVLCTHRASMAVCWRNGV